MILKIKLDTEELASISWLIDFLTDYKDLMQTELKESCSNSINPIKDLKNIYNRSLDI